MSKLHQSTKLGVLYNTTSESDRGTGGNGNGIIHVGGTSTRSWESYTREMLIEGLSDLRSLHEMELESRKEVEQKQFVQIENMKYEMNTLRNIL